jgi:hypothetical protein
VAGTLATAGQTATFVPTGGLLANTLYTGTITTAVQDRAGRPLASSFVWTFTTGAAPDTQAPAVTSSNPANGATAVATNQRVLVIFTEAMNPASLNSNSFTLTAPGSVAVSGIVSYVGRTATFVPSTPLANSTRYSGTVTTAATDLAGNPLAANFSWTFTTGAVADTTVPTVTSTLPANAAIGMGINTQITANFSEGMDPATLSTAAFIVAGPGNTPIAGTVTYVGLTATFSPNAPLSNSTVYTGLITRGAKDLAGNALAANYSWTFTTGAARDTSIPTVTSNVPAVNAIGVAINQKISATFSEGMDPTTISTASFTVTGPGSTAIAGTVTYVGLTATFTPNGALDNSTAYTARFTTAVKDLAGNPLATTYSWTFTTSAAPDTTAPTVSTTDPNSNATGVSINQKVNATFSEGMDATTITNVNFKLTGPGTTPVAGTVTFVGLTATFTPGVPLANSTLYTGTVTTGVEDLAGNPLATNYSWTFTTGAAPDTTAPSVSSTDPSPNSTGVSINQKVNATFSEGMDPTTITNLNFKLTGPGTTPVAGTVTYVGPTASFTPNAPLANSTVYTGTVTTSVQDLAGNPLAANYSWTFTTGAAPDTTAPTVTSTDPNSNATGVPINQKVLATFSEGMDPTTMTNLNFKLTGPGTTPIAGTVTYVGLTATFTPNAPLANSVVYTSTVTTAVKDLAGNSLAANYSWTFTTGAAPDTTAPTVTATAPVSGAINVSFNQKVTVAFSEAMDPLTLTNLSFTLQGPGSTPVTGTVTYTGLTATFTPNANLTSSTTFTGTVTTVAKDLAGNRLAANFSWTFATGAAPDTIAPTVTATNPLAGATDVALNPTVRATFSEAMDPTTITNQSFTVAGAPATVSYDVATKVASLKPTANLNANTLYVATVSTSAKDLAGNPLASNFSWSFTTGQRIVPTPAVLGAIAPFGSFGGGAGMTNQGTLTVVNGDIGTSGASTTMTGFFDSTGAQYTVTPLNAGRVNGTVFTASAPPGSTAAAQGAIDARIAYNNLTPASLPGGINLGTSQLGGLTLRPGIYQSASGSYLITGSDLTLDAQNDPDAVWVFQMATSLTVGGPGAAFPRSIILANGAQPKNIFWQVGSAATINAGGGGTMVGTVIAQAGVTISTAGSLIISTFNGRALGLDASVTMVNTILNIPAP